MAGIKDIEGYDDFVINICPDGTEGEIIEIAGLFIQLPEKPDDSNILFNELPKEEQYWRRLSIPKELERIRTMDEWSEAPKEFRDRYTPYIEREFVRRRKGLWFYNNGIPTYITGHHYMLLQWSKMDIGYASYLDFQRKLFIHYAACESDPRSVGQVYVKCRRSGYTNVSSSILVDEGTQVAEKLLGIISKTGKDAQENVFMKKVFPMFRSYPFFFKPVQDGTTNPRMELAFREPSKRITKNNKAVMMTQALDTVINWKNTVNNAYDGEKLHTLFLDECFSPGTKVLMSDMTFKSIEDINVGDFVMVDGGKVVEVAKTFHGYDNMYTVHQPYGKDYTVNSKHRLVLNNYHYGEIIITPEEYLSNTYSYKRHTTRVTSKPIEFKEKELTMDPYLLGVWLGDGFSSGECIIVNVDLDNEIIEYLDSYAKSFGGSIRINSVPKTDKAKTISFDFNAMGANQSTGRKNLFKKQLEDIGVLRNKHIPYDYMTSSVSQRLSLLAGIIDTDGHLNKRNSYEIGMSRKELIEQIYMLAKSCGLDVSEVSSKKSNYDTDVYSVRITGSKDIPCLIKRKKSESRSFYSSRRSKIDIKPSGYGEYFGIQLKANSDDDRRLILGDFTVSMNCGKYESPIDVNELWRIHRTCLLVGKKVVGKALLGSTVNPLDKGGANFRKLYYDSDPKKRNENGRTKSGLYKIFIPAYEALEGFFDQYGLPIVNDPEKPINTMEGDITKIGAKTYLNNERKALMSDPYELNEVIRQFPWTEEEAFRDSTKTSHFNISKIYEQIEHNANLFPNPVIRGNFIWNNGQQDSKVVFAPDPNGKFRVSWLMPFEESNKQTIQNGKRSPGNVHLGVGGVDSYDIDETADGRGSKGAFHFFNKFNMNYPSNRFVLEYAERPELARVFYEDVLMAAVYYGYPLLVENNKYGIVRYFESRGYDNYIMDRPPHLTPPNQRGNVRTKGVPSNSQEFIQAHAQAIEAFIHEHIGYRVDTDEYGKMYFDRTLQDWIGYKISDRTKFDLTISSGLALLGAQTIIKEKKQGDMTEKVFFRRYKARF